MKFSIYSMYWYNYLMNEASVQTKFNHYLRAKWITGRSAAFELKICKTEGGIPFSAVQEHQVAALCAVRYDKMIYKIPDVGLGRKPFDDMVLSGIEAYVVIIYHYDRKYTRAYLIDVDDWCLESDASERRSLLEERAREIATEIFEL